MTALAVARLLVRYRLRSLWNGAWRVPRQRTLRVAWLLLLLAPVTYVGLFATAFGVIVETAPLPAQAAVLALVAGVIAFASAAGKMASNEAVVGGSGENEFLLARPIDLPTLVIARSLAGVATNLFDALFLFPVLVSAALVWDLGLAGVLAAAVISALVQVGVTAAAQAAQLVVVRMVPPARRRAVWSALALLAALSMACLWMLGIAVLRRPAALAHAVGPWVTALHLSPGGWIVEPLYALARGCGGAALLAFAAPLELTVLALLFADTIVDWAGGAGWEQAGIPWAEAARGPRPGAPMTLFTKDWYLIARDRSRLVTLVALPVIFVGVGVFGSIGWSWTTGTPHHIAVLGYSLAAYMAGLGPLAHMEAERRSFWLLRVAPVSLGRLLAWKAAFWSALIGGAAAIVIFGLLALSQLPLTIDAVALGLFAVLGAVTASCLAVAMGSGTADFSDDTRRALGPGTLYLFLVVAGLFNVALLESGVVRLRIVCLYGAALALHWIAGVEGAGRVFDPHGPGRRVLAADGATLATMLFLGARAQQMAGLLEVPWAALVWPGLLGLGAAIYLLRRPPGPAGWRVAPALGVGLALGVLGSLARLHPWPPLPSAPLILRGVVDELIVRGMIQRGLQARGRAVAATVAALVALMAGARPLGLEAVLVAVIPSLAMALSGRWSSALAGRLVLEL